MSTTEMKWSITTKLNGLSDKILEEILHVIEEKEKEPVKLLNGDNLERPFKKHDEVFKQLAQ